MKCYTCSSDIDASMRHAVSMNSCPFCGRTIFSAQEFEYRKTVQRILIKNGLEDEEKMSRIVDDITTALGEQFTRDREVKEAGPQQDEDRVTRRVPAGGKIVKTASGSFTKKDAFGVMEILDPSPARPAQRRVASQEEIEEAMAAEEDGSDEDNAPTRALTPAPRSGAPRPMTKADQMAIAVQEWTKAQQIDYNDDNITHAQDIPDEEESDGSEFFSEAPSAGMDKIARMQKAASEERIRQVQANSGFKNQPIRRAK